MENMKNNLVLPTKQDELLGELNRFAVENSAEEKARLAEERMQEEERYKLERINQIHNAFISNFIKLNLSLFNLKIKQLANLEGKLEELDELIVRKARPWVRVQKLFFCLS